jgi:CDP-2,3-bis-(O-geranylgeranyl)-sn-glycerol synthase
MIKFALMCIWYLLPAALGNHVASCGNRLWLPLSVKEALARLARPVDSGALWRGKEIFGKHKTWRGIVMGVITGMITAGIQSALFLNFAFFRVNTLVDYSRVNFALFGALLGAGALTGDLVKSFIKRRAGVASGKPWFPWDQLDWITGSMLFGCVLYVPPVSVVAVTVVLYTIVHLCSDRIVFLMGIKTRQEVN